QMYEIIRTHPTVRELYSSFLQENGIVSHEEIELMQKKAFETLEDAKRDADASLLPFEQEELDGLNGDYDELEQPPAISAQALKKLNAELLSLPGDFSLNPKIARLLQRRATTLGSDGGID